MSVVKKYIFVFACILLSVKSLAQAPSPYSTFGIGEPYGNALAHSQGMGGVGVAQPQWWFLNNQNPALLVYNTLTVFQAGIVAENRTIKGDTASEKVSGGNLNYLITAFPILPAKRPGQTSRWTTSLGLMPLTSVNYKLRYAERIDGSTQDVIITEEGSGGLTQLFWSNGIRVNDNFSVGAKISYVFSSVVNSYKNDLPSSASPVGYIVGFDEQTYIKDFTFGFGGSFSKDSIGSKNYRLSIGAVANMPTDLKAKRTTQFYRANGLGEPLEKDTLAEQRGSLHLPASLTAGISFSRGLNWNVGTEFSFQDWTTFRSLNTEDEGLKQSWRWALGGEFTPDPAAVENYLKRITYRLGVSYEKTPYSAPVGANSKPVKDLGATFGFSVPAGRSSLDLSFKFGKRGNKAENLIEESYFRVYFGITFNDQWFVKRKFD
jgi:hypothetical protein